MNIRGMAMGSVLSRRFAFILLSALALAVPAWTAPARAGGIFLGPIQLGGVGVTVHVQSFRARKFTDTIRQAHDYSCGSAALATLLTYAYGIPVTEQAIFRSMIGHGNRARIERLGFSLLDLKEYLKRHGLQAGGFRAPLAKLAQVGVPAIVLIDHEGYRHFVVVRGIEGGLVLVSDPSLGTRTIPVSRFSSQWNGIFFLVLTDAGRAQESFNDRKIWAAAPRPPGDLARFQIDLLTAPAAGIRNPNVF